MSPELMLKIEAVALCAIIAWGLVEWLKPLLNALGWEKGSNKIRSVTRLAALIIGALVGAVIYPELGGQSWKLGGALGACAGALNAMLVAIVKKRIKGLSDANNTNK